MSSRVIRSASRTSAEPITWRRVGGLAGATGHRGSGPQTVHTAESEPRAEVRAQAAYRQGYTAGEAAAGPRAIERLEPVLASLRAVVQELAGVRKRFRTEAEEDTVKLAIAIARRVMHRELATDPDAILGLVMAAFQKLNARETQHLRLSPADAAVVEQHRARLELPPGLEIVSDTSLVAGSAVFETARGELDASIDTQLAEIQRGFADILKRRPV